jgi:hypothetical protein
MNGASAAQGERSGGDPRMDHVVIVGHGRSGTNLLLDIADCHPWTLCRNEPNEVLGSRLARLPDGFGSVTDHGGTFPAAWREAVMEARSRRSARDRLWSFTKAYVRSPLHAALVRRALEPASLRRLRRAARLGGGDEWALPSAVLRRDAMARSTLVLKILLQPHWQTQTHAAEPRQRVAHVVRDPVAFIRSWHARYVLQTVGDPEAVFRDNLRQWPLIGARLGAAAHLPTAYSPEALVRSETLRWRYVNEVLFEGLRGSARYCVFNYRFLVHNRTQAAERMFAFAGLEMDAETRARIGRVENTLFAPRPQGALDEAMVRAVVAEAIHGSPLCDLLSCDVFTGGGEASADALSSPGI